MPIQEFPGTSNSAVFRTWAANLRREISTIDENGESNAQAAQAAQTTATQADAKADTVTTDLSVHAAQAATTLVLGHVLQGIAVANAVQSSADVTSADAGATYTAAEQTLINELKSDLNTAIADFNNAVIQINALISSLETSGAIDT